VTACAASGTTRPPADSPSGTGGPLNALPDSYGVIYEAPYADDPLAGDLEGAILVRERISLVGQDGLTTGAGELSAVDFREEHDQIACGGTRYTDRFAHDLDKPNGQFSASFSSGGSLVLTAARQIVVYADEGETGGYPECFEQFGTYVFTPSEGPPVTGSYHLLDGSLELTGD
jgi:hypothetical protein